MAFRSYGVKKFFTSPYVIFLAAVVLYTFLYLAWLQYDHEYSIVSNNISRLGRPTWNPNGYIYSFLGTAGSAILMLGFYRSLYIWKTGDRNLDRGVSLMTTLGYTASACLFGIAVFNGDHHLTHKILGGIYFGLDVVLMLLGVYVAFRHPRIDKILIFFCILSAALDIIYLQSDAKWSWAEWGSVAMSFTVGFWLAVIHKRVVAFSGRQS